MKLCAIICELNPPTNGHEYVIKKARELTNEDVLLLMSGNFVQRGEMAILSKFQRAMSGITLGASMVFELPLAFSISPADKFAYGAVKVLSNLGTVSHLAFGIETDDIETLKWIAERRANESPALSKKIKELSIRLGYNVAIKEALSSVYPEKAAALEEIFKGPNNILAIEYLVALIKLNSPIEPLFIKRIDSGYYSSSPKEIDGTCYSSASHIRELAIKNKFGELSKLIPSCVFASLKKANISQFNDWQSRLSALVLASLRNKTKAELNTYFDYTPPISSLVINAAKTSATLNQFCAVASAKNLRESRARRLALYPYFGLTKAVFNDLLVEDLPINVLAASKDKKALLSHIISESRCPLLVSNKDRENLTASQKMLAAYDNQGSFLYNIATNQNYSEDKTLFI